MPLISITDLADERLAPYRDLRSHNLTRYSGRFIAESRLLVERLLRSDHQTVSIVVDESQLRFLPPGIEASVPVYVIPPRKIGELLGYDFHRGVLGCGLRKPSVSLADLPAITSHPRWTGVYLNRVQDPENMGLIARTCAALGIEDFWLGPGCVDPYCRRVLRVSMGGILSLRIHEAGNDLAAIRLAQELGIECVATSLSPTSVPLETFVRQPATLVLLGNEAHGLSDELQRQANRAVRIDMKLGTDSLNVSVAAGIVLHYLTVMARSHPLPH